MSGRCEGCEKSKNTTTCTGSDLDKLSDNNKSRTKYVKFYCENWAFYTVFDFSVSKEACFVE